MSALHAPWLRQTAGRLIEAVRARFELLTALGLVAGALGVVAALITIDEYLARNEGSAGASTVVVAGAVTDGLGRPVQGALVRLADGSAETVSRPDGGFTLRLPAAERGAEIGLRVERNGYRSGELTHTVGQQTAWVVLEREQTGPGAVSAVHLCGWEPRLEEIVLCNEGARSLDLGGWRLTDGEGVYQFPAETRLAPGERRIFTAEQYNPGRVASRLMLNNEHDEIRLLDPEGEIVDEVSW